METRGIPMQHILVAVRFGVASRWALRWANDLRQALPLDLRLVHAVPALANASQVQGMRETLREWAAAEVGVHVPAESILVGAGTPLDVILQAAALPDVALLVVGGPLATDEQGRSELLHSLLHRCTVPLLVVGPHGQRPVIVAATEGVELPPAIVGLADWMTSVAGGEVATLGKASVASQILATARQRQADLVIVATPRERAEDSPVADDVLDEARRTVLFVPSKPET